MVLALIKKQLLESTAFLTIGRDGKIRSKWAILGFVALLLYGLGGAVVMFYLLSSALCEAFVMMGQEWIYFSLMGMMAMTVGVLFGIIIARNKLYEAKDNEFLLAMPIPEWVILFVRIAELYVYTFVIEAAVFLPALVNYFLVAGFSLPTLLYGVLAVLVLPLGSLAICCLIGFLLSAILTKLPFKNFFAILGFGIFFAVYMLMYSKINEYLAYVLQYGEKIGDIMQTFFYPLAQLGHGVMGDGIALLISLGICIGIFLLVYALLSVTYLKIATSKSGEIRAKYKEKSYRGASPLWAFFKKEATHLFKTPMYLLNTSMGTVFMLILGVVSFVGGDVFGFDFAALPAVPELANAMGLLVALIVLFMSSSNTLTACSVSVEGNRIWISQSMPVDSWIVLKGKLLLQIAFTLLPAIFCGISLCYVTGVEWYYYAFAILTAVVASVLFASMGLAVNLKFPMLRWTNEIVAVKQSTSVMIGMFGGWSISLLPLGGYFLFGKYLPPLLYLGMWLVVYAAAGIYLLLWLKKRGAEIYSGLTA